jgi:hypothetical protein
MADTTETTGSRSDTATTTTKPVKAPKAPSFSLEAVEKIVAESLAKQRAEFLQAMADQQAKDKAEANAKVIPATKISMAGKGDQAIKNEIQTVRAFKKLGITAKPHVDTFTFNIWVSKGYRPKEGSKSVRVNNLRLFHESQVRKLSKEELAANKEQKSASEKRQKSAKVIPIGGEANPQ